MYAPFYESIHFGKNNDISMFRTEQMNFPPHMHMYIELYFLISGETEITIHQVTQVLKAGDLGIALSNDIHSYKTDTSSEGLLLIFSPEYITDTLPELGKLGSSFESPFITSDAMTSELTFCLHALFEEVHGNHHPAIIKGYLNVLFGRFSKLLTLRQQPETEKGYSIHLQKIMKYLQDHYEQKITLDDISRHTGLNKFYISHIFKAAVGYGLNDYLNILRINKAKNLLITTNSSALEIALECGFESQRHFNRIFKEMVSGTPSGYRRMSK